MTHIIQDFSKWKRVNEDKVRQKVVATPIDKQNLKLKLINFSGVLDASSKLTQAGFDELLTWIKSQAEIIQYYPALNDLKSNIVVYSVGRDSDRKDLINFNIGPKAAIGGISPELQFVRADELGLAKQGKLFKGGAGGGSDQKPEILTSQTKAGFTLPFSSEGIKDSTDLKIIEFIKGAYLKVKMDSTAAANPIMAKVKAELNAKKLGGASRAFVVGLNAAYGIKDWSGDEIETAITQKLVDALAKVKAAESKELFLGLDAQALMETESTILPGFDIDEFNNGIANANKYISSDTGDIKVPVGGFKEGLQNDPELKKFQDLLVKKLSKPLANHSTFQKFKKAGAKGFKGNYGPLTKDLVYLLKAIAENPVYPNRDGSTIEPEFVNMIQKINESAGQTYLGLNGSSLVFEDFNFGAANAVSPSSGGGGGGGGSVKREEAKKKEEKVSSARQLEGINFEYTVKDGFWMYRKKGSKDKWQKAANPSNIIKLQKNFSGDGGGYIRPSDLNYVYKYEGGTWKVKVGGSWQEANDASKQELIKLYGTPGGTGAKTVSSSMSVKQIDEAHKKVANTIASWFPKEGEGPFAEFKSSGAATFFSAGIVNDSEAKAWKEFQRKWNAGEGSIKVQLNKTLAAINLLPQDETKTRLKTNQDLLAGIVKDGGTFYKKFMGGTTDDNFYLKLTQSDGTDFRKTIDTDF